MKKFFFALALLFAFDAHALTPAQLCAEQIPYGQPISQKTDTALRCRTAYLVEHNNSAKIPDWVAYTLKPENVDGCVKRSNAFKPDRSIPKGQRAERIDYAKSGYDTGHIANAADMAWDVKVERESFLLSNMAPQLPALNRGIWKSLETNVRGWAYTRDSTLLIYAGPIYDMRISQKIGPNRVVVPEAFYKIVVDTKTADTLAFIFPHADHDTGDLRRFLVPVRDVEHLTKITFPVPGSKLLAGALWDNDLGALAENKRAVCAAD